MPRTVEQLDKALAQLEAWQQSAREVPALPRLSPAEILSSDPLLIRAHGGSQSSKLSTGDLRDWILQQWGLPPLDITSDRTLDLKTDRNHVLCADASAGPLTLTLPIVTALEMGAVMIVQKTDSSAHNVSLPDLNLSLAHQGDWVQLIVRNTGWISLQGGHRQTLENATTSIAGIVELATPAEAREATLIDRAVTPAALAATRPVGAIYYAASSTPPYGTLICDGAFYSKTTYADLFAAIGVLYGEEGDNFAVPDLRGEFIRGVDLGRAVDPGRILGSWQDDAFRSHHHTRAQLGAFVGSGSYWYGARSPGQGNTALKTSDTGGSETRPRNLALLPVIVY